MSPARRRDRFHTPYQNWYDIIRIEYNEDVDVWNSVSVGLEKGVYEYKEERRIQLISATSSEKGGEWLHLLATLKYAIKSPVNVTGKKKQIQKIHWI